MGPCPEDDLLQWPGCPSRDRLRAFVDEDPDLDEDDRRAVELHLETCPRCQRRCEVDIVPPDPSTLPWEETAPEAERSGHPRIPGYDLLDVAGEGGGGMVYRARELKTGRIVALKLMKEKDADIDELRRRFEQEALTLANLQHPGIPALYDMGEADGRLYYTMPLVGRNTLEQKIEHLHHEESRDDRGEKIRELLERFIDACNAVAYAHSRRVIHRDLKPSNVMIGDFEQTFVIDWGLGRPEGLRETAGDPVAPPTAGWRAIDSGPGFRGTLGYCSPEQAEGDTDRIDHRSDIYSLGATLYHLVTGSAPLAGCRDRREKLGKTSRGDIPLPRSLRPDVDPGLEAICLRAMRLFPADRYHTAPALAQDLRKWLDGEPVGPEPPWKRAWRQVVKHPTLATASLLLCLVLVVGNFAYGAARAAGEARRQEKLARFESGRSVVVVEGVGSSLKGIMDKTMRDTERFLSRLPPPAQQMVRARFHSVRLDLLEDSRQRCQRLVNTYGDVASLKRLLAEIHSYKSQLHREGGETERAWLDLQSPIILREAARDLEVDSSRRAANARDSEAYRAALKALGGPDLERMVPGPAAAPPRGGVSRNAAESRGGL